MDDFFYNFFLTHANAAFRMRHTVFFSEKCGSYCKKSYLCISFPRISDVLYFTTLK